MVVNSCCGRFSDDHLGKWKKSKGSGKGQPEIVRLKANMEEIFFAILKHREDGHGIRFKPHGARAVVYCFECRKEIGDGTREFIEGIYESVLQVPRGCMADRWQRHFPSLD
jgi:hypothetical protein